MTRASSSRLTDRLERRRRIVAAGCHKKVPPPAPAPPPPPPAAPRRRRRRRPAAAAAATRPPPAADRGGDLRAEVARSAERRASARRRVLRPRQVGDPRRRDAALQKDADWMKKWTSTQVTVEGHCDSRGSSEYNLGSRLAPRDRREGLSRQPRRAGRARVTVVSKGKEAAVLQRGERILLAAEPPRPLRDYGEVGAAGSGRAR